MKRPNAGDAPDSLFSYINRVPEGDLGEILKAQLQEVTARFSAMAEDDSLYRYAPGKWSIRQILSHINDCERLFTFRAFWFARGFDSPLPGFEQEVAAAGAEADSLGLQSHISDFRSVRMATLSFVEGLRAESWDRRGVAGESPITVRALLYVAAGHVMHHLAILKERYHR